MIDGLEYLWRAADSIEKLYAAGAREDADRLFDRTLDALEKELAARGNVHEPALFEDLLLATQLERELQAVKERAKRGSD